MRQLGIYIATMLERAGAHNVVRDWLVARGHRLTYDWTVHGSVAKEGADRLREVAVKEKEGVRRADAVVVLLPGGRGTHGELGMSVILDKPTFLHAPDEHGFMALDSRTCAFYHDPAVFAFTGPFDTLLEALAAWIEPLEQQTGIVPDPLALAALELHLLQRGEPVPVGIRGAVHHALQEAECSSPRSPTL